jgi:hypothetical protein
VESQTARILGLGVPAGFEEFFLTTGRPAPELTIPPASGEPLDTKQMISAAHAAGCDIIGPPMTAAP